MDALSPFQDEEEVPDKNSTRCGGSILLSLTRWFQANNEMEMKKKKMEWTMLKYIVSH